jgi:hypothetical protein
MYLVTSDPDLNSAYFKSACSPDKFSPLSDSNFIIHLLPWSQAVICQLSGAFCLSSLCTTVATPYVTWPYHVSSLLYCAGYSFLPLVTHHLLHFSLRFSCCITSFFHWLAILQSTGLVQYFSSFILTTTIWLSQYAYSLDEIGPRMRCSLPWLFV